MALTSSPRAAFSRSKVMTGLDRLEQQQFAPLRGHHVGVVCNETAVDSRGRRLVDLLTSAPDIHLTAIFGPEHGVRGDHDNAFGDSADSRTSVPVYSLYDYHQPVSTRYRLTDRMLRGVDTIVFDIQDIGVRYYTYITTLGYVLEEAGKRGIPVVVLDRPNPLGGCDVEGPDLDLRFRTFAGYHNTPIMHGLTVGEMALLLNAEKDLHCNVQVVPMDGWRRSMLFEQTGLRWINPSPNIRSPREAALYAGVGFLEDLPISVGRGTRTPFEILGAPWIDGRAMARRLRSANLPGVTFQAVRFTPQTSDWRGRRCGGIRIRVTNRRALRPVLLGLTLESALWSLYPRQLTPDRLRETRSMVGTDTVPDAIIAGESPPHIEASWSAQIEEWKRRRQPYLLYP